MKSDVVAVVVIVRAKEKVAAATLADETGERHGAGDGCAWLDGRVCSGRDGVGMRQLIGG